jgi:hypothetical protein
VAVEQQSAEVITAAAADQLAAGSAVLPVRGKIPWNGERDTPLQGWEALRLTPGELPHYFVGNITGIGLLLGAASGGLADIDLDCDEAILAAAAFLPTTACIFGRASKPRSHYIFRTEAVRTVRFRDVDADRTTLLELRSDGTQTIFPPSIHPSGERVAYDSAGLPAHVDGEELRTTVEQLAATTLLARHWPHHTGSRHDLALALAGFLLRGGLARAVTEKILGTAARVAGDGESRDRIAAVRSTVDALAAGRNVTGGPTLATLLKARVIERMAEWLHLIDARLGHGRHRAYGAIPDDNGGRAPQRNTAEAWPALQPLPDEALPSVPTLPAALLPAALRPWLADAAERLDVPLELVATPALVMLGGLIGRRLGIHPKRLDDWLVVANLWGLVVARPGFLKSPAMEEARKPLAWLAAQATAAHKTNQAKAELDRAVLETELAKLKKMAMGKNGDPEKIRADFENLQKKLAAAVAIPTRYYTNDATVEKLGALLNENPAGLVLLRDELAGWLCSLEKQGREGDREFFLEAWNGTGDFYVDRIGRGTLHIPALTIGICGTMQPGKLRAYVAEALAEGRGADGLLQRFQLLAWPDFANEWHNVDRRPDVEARHRARQVFEAVVQLPESAEIPAVHFAPAAQEVFDDWRQALETRLRSDEFTDCPAYESHVAKYRSLMPALALILHVADNGQAGFGGFGTTPVGLAAAQTAAALVDFYDQHARRVYAPELSQLRSPRALLAAKIRAGVVRDGDSIRTVWRHGWSGLKTAEAVEHACAALVPFGVLRLEDIPPGPEGGRPSRILRLHPTLRTEAL